MAPREIDGDLPAVPIPATLEYRALAARNIRLLVLHRSASKWDHITTTLRTVHLDEIDSSKRSFAAVSYCWGDAGHTHPIQCNGRPTRVTASLYGFLRAMQARLDSEAADDSADFLDDDYDGTSPSGALLWVDALCINQADAAEKNAQVAMMADIYQRAAAVHVWLGAADTTSFAAMAALTEWADVRTRLILTATAAAAAATAAARGYNTTARRAAVKMAQMCRDAYAHHLRADAWASNKMRAVAALVSRPWFSRAWTFAETVLASRQGRAQGRAAWPGQDQGLVLWCGGDRLDWRYLADAYDGLYRAGVAATVFGPNHANVHAVVCWRRLLAPRRQNTNSNLVDDMSLSYLLQFTNLRGTADPRDTIYSLLGVLAVGGGSCPEPAKFVARSCPVTYEASVADVFTRYAVLMIRHEKSLRTLSHCYRGHSLPSSDIPSWVPDWRVSTRLRPLHKFGLPTDRSGGGGSCGNTAASAKTSSQESPIVFVDPATKCLHVRGKALGEIAAVYDVLDDMPRPDERGQSFNEGLSAITDLYKSLRCFPPLLEPNNTAGSKARRARQTPYDFLATLCGGALPRGLHTSPLSREDERDHFPAHFAWEFPLGWREEEQQQQDRDGLLLMLPDHPGDAAVTATAAAAAATAAVSRTVAAALEEAHQALLHTGGGPAASPASGGLRKRLRSVLRGSHISAEFLGRADVRERMAAEIAAFARATMLHRVFFLTTDGAMGIAPATAQPGDRLYALRGWCAPFLLRPVGAADDVVAGANDHVKDHGGKEFQIVGDVYLHAMDDGADAVLDGFRDGRVQPPGGGAGAWYSSQKRPALEEVVLV